MARKPLWHVGGEVAGNMVAAVREMNGSAQFTSSSALRLGPGK